MAKLGWQPGSRRDVAVYSSIHFLSSVQGTCMSLSTLIQEALFSSLFELPKDPYHRYSK